MFLIVLQHALFYSGVYDLSYSMGGVNFYSIIFTFLHSICGRTRIFPWLTSTDHA